MEPWVKSNWSNFRRSCPISKNLGLIKLLSWTDEIRKLRILANADYPRDAQRAREYGAEGISLCRNEHMFFEAERMPIVQAMIMARHVLERKEFLDQLLPLQPEDFAGIGGSQGPDPAFPYPQ